MILVTMVTRISMYINILVAGQLQVKGRVMPFQ